MIHPSYTELIEAINTNNEDDDESMVLNSRYSLILATKNAHDGHGYGLKSVRKCVEKYNGSMDITAENHMFSLTIIIPVAK